MSDRFTARYRLETPFALEEAAAAIAGEQSTGTFLKLPGETEALIARAAARVESIEPLEGPEAPSLPGAARPTDWDGRFRRAEIEISWPLENIGPSLPNLLATVAGNCFELRQLTGLKLLDLYLPPAFGAANPGPQFGIAGTRRLAGVEGRPLIGTIVKPSIGLTAPETAELVGQLCAAGIDFIKDDELQADGPGCPFEERARLCLEAIDRRAQKSGRKAMYAVNLTGEVDEMRRRHDLVMRLGGSCVMASLNSVGVSGLLALRRHAALPIHAHRNGWGPFDRSPALGWSYVAWQKIWRLAGADHMHVNGLGNKFCESDESVVASARACLTPLFDDMPCLALPVFSSGQSAATVAATHAALGSADLLFCAGGGVTGHPDGPAAGVASLREAWEAAMAGVPAAEHAADHPALARALAFYAT